MKGLVKSDYLAGLWRQQLAYQLLWEVRGVQWLVRRGQPNEYIAPSWSWASVVGRLENVSDVRFADEREIILEVLEVKVELLNALAPFGQVKNRFLRVKGCLAKGSLFKSQLRDNYLQISISKDGFRTVILDDGNEGTEIVGREFYFLPIQYLSRDETVLRSGVSMGVPRVAWIILPQMSSLKGEYTRVGRFEDFATPVDFQSACRRIAAQVGCGKEEVEGWGSRHVLTIL